MPSKKYVPITGNLAQVLGTSMYAMENAQRLIVPPQNPRNMTTLRIVDLLDAQFDWGSDERCWDQPNRCVIYECSQPMVEGLQMQKVYWGPWPLPGHSRAEAGKE